MAIIRQSTLSIAAAFLVWVILGFVGWQWDVSAWMGFTRALAVGFWAGAVALIVSEVE